MELLRDILTEATVADLARQALGDPGAAVDGWRLDPVDYDFGTPTTKGAVRIHGPGWSVFVKVIQAYRHWPMLGMLPPEMQQRVLGSPLWRHEADLYASRVGELLPPGLRLPTLYGVFELGDDRVAIAMEDVAVVDAGWDDRRFAQAARLIGRTAVRLTRADALPASASRTAGELSRLLYEFNLQTFVFPALADGRTWAHPVMAAGQEPLQRDLTELAGRLPDLLEHLDRLPQLMIHGDASPQNLLIPAGDPDTLVAIDWSLGGVAPVGDDLAQLLIGLAHAAQLPVAKLPGIREIIIDAYLEGLAEEGFAADRGQVACGLDGALAVRATFTALPLERLHEPRSDELDDLLRNRLELTRYLCDLGLSVARLSAGPAGTESTRCPAPARRSDNGGVTMPFPSPTDPAAGRGEVFVRYLDYFRETVVSKVQALPDDELRRSRLASGWTPLQLVKHLRFVELRWIEWGFQGQLVDEPWGDRRDDKWYVGPEETRDELLAALRAQGAHTAAVIAGSDLTATGVPGPRWDGAEPPPLERVLFHLVQEYARHAGHLDIVVELASGAVGE